MSNDEADLNGTKSSIFLHTMGQEEHAVKTLILTDLKVSSYD